MRIALAFLICFAVATPALADTIPAPPDAVMHPAPPIIAEPPPSMVEQLRDLQARYVALKANNDKSARMLLIAGALAAGLKLLLSGLSLLLAKRPKKWLAIVALGLAVPIALLSHFAAGNSWFDSFIYAGAGPGAIVVHELFKIFGKSKGAE